LKAGAANNRLDVEWKKNGISCFESGAESMVGKENIMSDFLEDAFSKMAKTYKRNLEQFWPTIGSRGITEANQTHEFCKALETTLPSPAFSYLEVPFGDKGWIDGVIVNVMNDNLRLIFVETKRIKENGYGAAYKSITSDAKRLVETPATFLANRKDLKQYKKIEVILVYLADVWVGNKKRSNEVIGIWESCSLFPSGWEGCKSFISDPVYQSQNDKGNEVKYHLLMVTASLAIESE